MSNVIVTEMASVKFPAERVVRTVSYGEFSNHYEIPGEKITDVAIGTRICSFRCAHAAFLAPRFYKQHGVITELERASGAEADIIAARNEPDVDRDAWSKHCVEWMKHVLERKFDNTFLRALLVLTGDAYIAHVPEAGVADSYWSTGHNRTGANTLGICLMFVRNRIIDPTRVRKLPLYCGAL